MMYILRLKNLLLLVKNWGLGFVPRPPPLFFKEAYTTVSDLHRHRVTRESKILNLPLTKAVSFLSLL